MQFDIDVPLSASIAKSNKIHKKKSNGFKFQIQKKSNIASRLIYPKKSVFKGNFQNNNSSKTQKQKQMMREMTTEELDAALDAYMKK